MTSSISSSSINSLNFIKATNAFKNYSKKPQEQSDTIIEEVGAPKEAEKMFTNHNISEIREIAQNSGVENLSDEDIKYGLYFGRSVIANYSV